MIGDYLELISNFELPSKYNQFETNGSKYRLKNIIEKHIQKVLNYSSDRQTDRKHYRSHVTLSAVYKNSSSEIGL